MDFIINIMQWHRSILIIPPILILAKENNYAEDQSSELHMILFNLL